MRPAESQLGAPPIRRLDPTTIAHIAAGEVVERPASVAKELVENALDAGATRIEVRIAQGGRELIEVADDGAGIRPEELELAVERYATSKLPMDGSLERIGSLGFRGEALSSIAAVSRFRIVSRASGAESAWGISVVGGAVAGRFELGRAPGTTVEVRDLFFATPARRKFLKSAPAEQVELLETLQGIYLARPGTALALTAEDREVARYPASARLRDAAGRVLGVDFLSASFGVDARLSDGSRLVAELGRPQIHRPSAASLRISVNGRAVRSRPIAMAIRLAYQEHLPRARFPVGVVHLELPTERVDVNVHPTKVEVRIAGERELLEGIRRAVRAALLAGPMGAEGRAFPVPLSAPPGPSRAASATSLPPSLAVGPALLEPGTLVQTRLPVGDSLVGIAAGAGRPALRLLGPAFDLFWVAEAADELWIIDQHAAHERLLYDRIRESGRIGRQELVEPVVVRLTERQREVWKARGAELEAAGFLVESFGPEVERVRAVPSYRGHTALATSLSELLDELADGGRPTVPDGGPERVAASIACHAAVRGGDRISPEALRGILGALDGLADPAYACPHGRPIVLRWSKARLFRGFLRSGSDG